MSSVQVYFDTLNRSGMTYKCDRQTSGPVTTEIGDRVRVQFPVPDIYFVM